MVRRIHGAFACTLLAAAFAAPAGAAEAGTEPKPPVTQPEGSDEDDVRKPVSPEDKSKVLREAIEQWRNKEYRKASINLTRLINSSKKDELEGLSDAAQKEAQMPLADLAAEVHFENAKEQSKTGMIRLQYVTTYENEPLVKRIDEAYKKAIDEPFTPPPTSRPAAKATKGEAGAEAKERDALQKANQRLHRKESEKPAEGREPVPGEPEQPATPSEAAGGVEAPAPLKIVEFMNNPKTFADRDCPPETCTAFAKHVSYTISLLDARMRLDTTLRTKKEEKTKLLAEKKNLEELRRTALTTAHMTPLQRKRAEEMRQRQEQMKQRKEQQQQRPRSQSPEPGTELERVIKRSTGGYGVR